MLETREREGRILHTTQSPVPVGTKGSCRLDWDRRLDHMQQHTGEHILSWAFWSLFGVENTGFHMGRELVTIDLSRPVTQEEMDAAEDLANRNIWENHPIRCYTATQAEVEKLTLRQAIDQLPERERMGILLRFYRNFTQDRVSKVLGVSQVQVSRIERRAVAHLREALTE